MTIKTKRKENEDPNAKFLSLQLLCLLTHTHTHGSLYFIHGPPKIMISRCQRLPYYNFLGAMNELQVCVLVAHFVSDFVTPWTLDQSRQAPLSMEFSRQEYWSGLPFPSPGDLPGPRIKPRSPALQADSLPSETPVKPTEIHRPPKTVYKHLCVKCIVLLSKGTDLQNIKNQ